MADLWIVQIESTHPETGDEFHVELIGHQSQIDKVSSLLFQMGYKRLYASWQQFDSSQLDEMTGGSEVDLFSTDQAKLGDELDNWLEQRHQQVVTEAAGRRVRRERMDGHNA